MRFKVVFFIAMMLLGGLDSFCQIQIDYSDLAKSGDGYIYAVKKFSTGELTIAELNRKGWDVSKYTPDSYDTVRYYNKSRSKYGKLFPNSDMVRFQTKKNMEFITMDSSRVRMQGIINDYLGLKAAVVLVFPTDLLVYKFPIKVGSVFQDSISKKFVSNYGLQQFSDSVRIDLEMSSKSVFDTCISIKTPMDSYTAIREKNVVKKRIVAYKNSHMMGWRPAPELCSRTTSVCYRWFAKNSGIAVLEAETDEYDNVRYIRYQYRAPMTVEVETVDIKCKGMSTGVATVKVDGGTPDYTYAWSNGRKGKKQENLPAGTYTVTVTDCKGAQAVKTFSIHEPNEKLTLNINYRDIRCYGDHDATLKAEVSGGTPPYYIIWNTEDEAEELHNQGTGIYGVIVRDANRCRVWDSVEIKAPSSMFTFVPEVEHAPCHGENGGKLVFDVKGGDGPYNYWLDGKPATHDVENVSAGTYTMRASDKWGCVLERTATVRQPDAPLSVEGDIKHVRCAASSDGAITLAVSGGTPGYTYEWSNGAESRDISRLQPGTYYLTVRDVKKCELKKSFIITGPSSILSLSLESNDIKCKGDNNGFIKVNGVGGVPPYTITINNKPKTPINERLHGGSYNVKVTDSNECSVIETVIIDEPDTEMQVTVETNPATTDLAGDGMYYIKVKGGVAPYQYNISDGNEAFRQIGVKPGHYSATVTDKAGCKIVKEFDITTKN